MPKKNKILVEVIGEEGIKSRKKRVIKGNTVVIEKPERGRGHAGWNPSFSKDAILFYETGRLFVKRLRRKLMVMDGAESCIEFKDKKVQVPVYGREASKDHIRANVLKSAGETTQKVTIPFYVYALLLMIIVFQVIQFLVSSGRIYIG